MRHRRVLHRAVAGAAASALLATLTTLGASAALSAKIAFTTDRDGQKEIYVMGTDGSSPVNLTNHVASDVDPAWSPDGSRIAFSSNRGGDFEIYVMAADGTNVTQITANLVDDRRPDWSPDGSRIAFDRNAGTQEDIWSSGPDGSSPIQLTATLERELSPSYSPDGTRIAYTRANRYLLNPDLSWEMLADGSRQVQFAGQHQSPDHARDPAWSPNGASVALARGGGGIPDGTTVPDDWTLSVMEEDATREHPVPGLEDQGISEVAEPSWSPDSARIVFTGGDKEAVGSREIYTVAPDGSGLTQLTDNTFTTGAYDGQPDWQPVGAPAHVPAPTVTERLLVSSSRAEATVTTTLFQPGVTYRVTVRGEYHWARSLQGQRTDALMADAECSTQGQKYLPNQFAAVNPQGDPLDLQLGAVPTTWIPLLADDVGCTTDADHTFSWTFKMAKAGRLNMKVADINPSAYSDNVGVLFVTIKPA